MAVERAYELVDKIAISEKKRDFSLHSSRTTICEL